MTTPQATLLAAARHAVSQGRLLPHQQAAFERLWDRLPEQERQRFSSDWRAQPMAGVAQVLLLDVPYFGQLDSATDQGARMCFSSTCAMLAEFLKPGCLSGGGQPDDRYLKIVNRFGDTTEIGAQIQALRTLGINAQFRKDGSIELLARKLAKKIPVPVGWLHRGPVEAPTGGGHWSLAVGWDPNLRNVIMHDPYGEALLTSGGYPVTESVPRPGRNRNYSELKWGRRWMVEGVGTGWWLDVS